MAPHRGKIGTYQKEKNLPKSERFFWHSMLNDVNEFVRKCDQFQKQGDLNFPKVQLKLIPMSSSVMKQVGVDLYNLPVADACYHVVRFLLTIFQNGGKISPSKTSQLQQWPSF